MAVERVRDADFANVVVAMWLLLCLKSAVAAPEPELNEAERIRVYVEKRQEN